MVSASCAILHTICGAYVVYMLCVCCGRAPQGMVSADHHTYLLCVLNLIACLYKLVIDSINLQVQWCNSICNHVYTQVILQLTCRLCAAFLPLIEPAQLLQMLFVQYIDCSSMCMTLGVQPGSEMLQNVRAAWSRMLTSDLQRTLPQIYASNAQNDVQLPMYIVLEKVNVLCVEQGKTTTTW